MQQETKNEAHKGYDNPAYEQADLAVRRRTSCCMDPKKTVVQDLERGDADEHATWSNSIEFLMSCIAISVGFGNIWRFPFTAYNNGGGAFLIPYIILLFLVGKPFYFLEMIIGQFSGSSSTRVWSVSPAFSGVGWAQFFSTVALVTYYSSLMSLTLYYLIASFSAELPWAKCRPEWADNCINSDNKVSDEPLNASFFRDAPHMRSSAELFFTKVVLHEKESIDDGIGFPDWKLTLCLLGSWIAICLVLSQGVKSSGKASYFLAIFPYVVLITLLIRAVTLDGAVKGILFFITPNWSKLLDPTVWYAAVTQCFFSLSVCFGAIITYSSHNDFKHNIYRDAMIVTTLDTVTSLIAGCTIFGILGNLAHEMDVSDITQVVRSDAGLAFVSYPDAIAKFTFVPQLFAFLFFIMMFVLGVGSGVGMTSSVVTVMNESYPKLKTWQVVIPASVVGFCLGTAYVTPGGQFILTLVDYYGTSFVVFILASFEIIGVVWVYGLENFLDDIEFMLDMKPSIYWRICWFIVTPILLIVIFFYMVITLQPLTYSGRTFPSIAHAVGWIILCLGVGQIPLWMGIALWKKKRYPVMQMIKRAFRPASNWGPRNVEHRKQWQAFKEEKAKLKKLRTQPAWMQTLYVLFNLEPK